MADPFVFETTYDPAAVQEEFVKAHYRSGAPSGDKMMLVAGVAGIVLLFSWYTFALGAAILAVCTFGFAMKNRSRDPKALNRVFNQGPVHVKLSDGGYSITAPTYTMTATWENVIGFSESPDYLLLRAMNARGTIYCSMAELKAAGLYERIKGLAEARRDAFATALKPAT